jgi:hypothetical protein
MNWLELTKEQKLQHVSSVAARRLELLAKSREARRTALATRQPRKAVRQPSFTSDAHAQLYASLPAEMRKLIGG